MEERQKECFIVTPIGDNNSSIRRETDGLIKAVFEPALNDHGIKPIAAHQIADAGSITRQVVKKILESELVIANLTELNPNVMYELGIRHCARKPTIVIAREGVNLPFDLNDERTIFYKNDIFGVEELKERLQTVIPNALRDEKPDNPVYRVVDVDLIKVSEGTTDADSIIDARLSLIEDQLSTISRSIKSTNNSTLKSLAPYKAKREFYVHEDDIHDFIEFCDEHEIPIDTKQVYKDQVGVTANISIPSQDLELRAFVSERTGVKAL